MSKQYPEAAMTSDLEIIRVAASLIREYGDQANIEAAQRANALLEKGDLQAQSEWGTGRRGRRGNSKPDQAERLGRSGCVATMHPTAPR